MGRKFRWKNHRGALKCKANINSNKYYWRGSQFSKQVRWSRFIRFRDTRRTFFLRSLRYAQTFTYSAARWVTSCNEVQERTHLPAEHDRDQDRRQEGSLTAALTISRVRFTRRMSAFAVYANFRFSFNNNDVETLYVLLYIKNITINFC